MAQRQTSPQSGEPEAVRVWLLGGFGGSIGSRGIEASRWRVKKAATLVKLLAIAPGHRLHREQVTNVLWPHLGTKSASNNLYRVLHSTRALLEAAPADAPFRHPALQGDTLALCPDGLLWTDVEAFEEAAIARRSREPAAYRAAVELYASDLLPEDRYEEWAQERRQALRKTLLVLLVELGSLHEERGEYEAAIAALRRVVAEEQTAEEAYVGLMRLYALECLLVPLTARRLRYVFIEPASLANGARQELEAKSSRADPETR